MDDIKEEIAKEERCGNCKYFAYPWCHRYPPKYSDDLEQTIFPCPPNGYHDWCGEYKLKKK